MRKNGKDIFLKDIWPSNKEIEDNQCTIVFYVDDIKISHRNPEVVTRVINEIGAKFGEMKVARGSKFDYLRIK